MATPKPDKQERMGGRFAAGAGLTTVMSLCKPNHNRWWRLDVSCPWVCGTCHPPPSAYVEWRHGAPQT